MRWTILFCLLNVCSCYKVLLVFPFPFKSHSILGRGFVRNLLSAGHEVTYVTPFALNSSHPKLYQVSLNLSSTHFEKYLDIKPLLERAEPMNYWDVFGLMRGVTEMAAKDIYSGFSALYDCPFIWFFPYDQYLEIFRVMHTPPNPAYTPNLRTRNIPPFTFQQRVQELWYSITTLFYRTYYYTPVEKGIYKNFFASAMSKRGKKLPDYDAVRFNASLAFSNAYVTMRDVSETPTALKNIGGFHIDTKLESLSQKLQDIMDRSTHGVILFSMGTHLTSRGLPKLVSEFVETFRRLKYTVLWKTNEANLTLPSNVIPLQWIPQVSVLDHPNCVLFITHGGLMSITESVHFGKPIVGIPAYSDQFINVRIAVKNGFAKEVKLSLDLGNELFDAINEVVNNPRYTQRAKEMSLIYHSRIAKPGAELVHWVQHVIETKGAQHLRSAALQMPLYQKCYLDLIIIVIILLTILRYIARRTFERLTRKTNGIKKTN
ncbi:unnamed protein product [Leptosia nina]|uniref:UDP-glucuronosyltransferase n=1 Tax=Leptosia nina TaxID=320188 RepID=A0AAV1JB69_9NEOP